MSTSRSNNLTQDGDLTNRDAYFASPELSQRADLLRHLTENSNLIPLIRGVEGMGKTTFIRNLLSLAPENWIPVKVNADVMLQPDALLAYLADLFDQDDRSEQLFDDLISYFEDLRHDGFLPVIIVDDAHLLPEASVITLLRLHERSTDERPLAQILLFAEPEIDELLKTPQLRVMNLQSLQLLDMPEFTLEQTGLFLEHLLSAKDASLVDSLTASQIEMIHDETGGLPGLIREHAKSLTASTNPAPKTKQQQSKSPSITMIGGGVVIVIVLLILIYQDEINGLFSRENDTLDTVRTELAEPEGYKPLILPDSEQTTISEQDEDESVSQELQGTIEVTEGKDSDLGSAAEENSSELKQTATDPQELAVKPEATQDKVEQAQVNPASAQEQVQLKSGEVSAVEASATAEKKQQAKPADLEKKAVEEVAAPSEQQKPQPVNDAKLVTKGEPKASKAAPTVSSGKTKQQPEIVQERPDASKPAPSIIKPQIKKSTKPLEVKKKSITQPAKPVVKAVAPKVKSQTKPAEAALAESVQGRAKPSAAPVVERSVSLPKQESAAVRVIDKPAATVVKSPRVVSKPVANKLLREQWLLNQKPSSYTIQLAGLQDEKGVAKFIQRHSLSGTIAYYRTQRNGKSWYPVLYGVYPTRIRANAVRDNLPESIVKSGPWVRTLNAVQKDIRAR